ncbi:hypothetical protein ACJJTC_012020 [Scirpophaga incertulas]
MLKLINFLLLLICLHQVAESQRMRLTTDSYRELLRKTYTSKSEGRSYVSRSDIDVGSPLLLTPYIEQNKLEDAREAAAVDPEVLTPGCGSKHNCIDSYSGFLTVNKEYNSNLWFWYFPVKNQPVEDTPWLIWLQGGPGVSSLFGLFTEIGPFVVNKDDKLEEIMYSWGKNHSLIFIDSPVGTGYSFTDDKRGFATSHTAVGEDLHTALQQFLTIFPELRKPPLIITGESYAGKYIPALGMQILKHKNDSPPINLQGLAIGNGWSDPGTLMNISYVAREVGLLDDHAADLMRTLEVTVREWIKNGELVKSFYYFADTIQILQTISNVSNIYNYLEEEVNLEGAHVSYIQQPEIRRALHVGNALYNATNYNDVYDNLVPVFMESVTPWIEELLEHYRVMIFNGHLDLLVAYKPTSDMCNALSFTGSSEFRNNKRTPWYHDGIIAGYVRKGGNLMEVMVRGAGHMVPSDKPAAAYALISAFVRDISLDEDTASIVPPENQ